MSGSLPRNWNKSDYLISTETNRIIEREKDKLMDVSRGGASVSVQMCPLSIPAGSIHDPQVWSPRPAYAKRLFL